MQALRLLVGLGNPGADYARTRHNAGFRVVDALADAAGERFKPDGKLFGETARVQLGGESVWLLKPSTFMNASGKSVLAALQFWKIDPAAMLVAHDELDLAPGIARLKFDGGHGGQNGLRDIHRVLGHGKYGRLRIGIGHPGHKDRVTGWVLGRAASEDDILTARAVDNAIEQLPSIARGEFNAAQKVLNSRGQEPEARGQ